MNILLTLKCNYRCGHCLYSCTNRGEHMQWKVLEKVFEIIELTSTAPHIIGGEPTLHPEFKDMVVELAVYAKHSGMSLVTNGWFYPHEVARRKIMVALEEITKILSPIIVEVSNDQYHRRFWKIPNQAVLTAEWMLHLLGNRISASAVNADKREYPIVPFGRGKKQQAPLSPYYEVMCANSPATEEESINRNLLWETVSVFPNGNVVPCCYPKSVSIGNLLNHTYEDIEDRLEYFLSYSHNHFAQCRGEEALEKCYTCKRIHKAFDYQTK